MKIQHRDNDRAATFLALIINISIPWIVMPASVKSTVETSPLIEIDTTSSETFVKVTNSNSEQFMQEQLHDSSSNIFSPLQQDVWSQPIGWLFSLTFVLLGSIVAWSKYTRNR
jgi:hypothetical protein